MLRKSVYITDYFDVAIDEDTYIKIRLGVAARSVRSSRPHRSRKGSISNQTNDTKVCLHYFDRQRMAFSRPIGTFCW